MVTRAREDLRTRVRASGGSLATVLARAAEASVAAIAFLALLAILVAPFRGPSIAGAVDRSLAYSDFGAFYCGALVMRTGGDPYRLAPLSACESRRVYGPAHLTMATVGIDPAPLPAYDFAFFAPFTLMPYRTAGLLWLALLVVAFGAAALALRRLTRLPLGLTLAALAFGDGAVCFTYGQEQPLVTLALVCSALALATSRDRLAVACAAVTFLEPQVGLPTMLALATFSRARTSAFAVMAAIGAVSFAYGGWHANLEYLTLVLPIHAFSELGISIQYSAASLLYAAGVPDTLALRIANLQYIVFAACGVAFAAPLARHIGRPALVLLPAACAVVGGPYVHIQEIASALPLALYLAGRVPASRPWSAIAVGLLALSWPVSVASHATLVLGAIVVGTLCVALRPLRTMRGDIACAVVLFTAYVGSAHVFASMPNRSVRDPELPAVVATSGFDPALASTQLAREWRAVRASNGATLPHLAERAPTWLGLLLVLGTAIAVGVRPRKKIMDHKASFDLVRVGEG